MNNSTRYNRSSPTDLDAMVMAPALPNLAAAGVRSGPNPPPSKSKVDTGESFSDSGIIKVNMSDPQQLGIWNMFKNCDDPSAVSHQYRSLRDSKNCSVAKPILRRMRDVMIQDMRENNSKEKNPRKQRQVGRNALHFNDPQLQFRRGA